MLQFLPKTALCRQAKTAYWLNAAKHRMVGYLIDC